MPEAIEMPKSDVSLTMAKAGRVLVMVDFTGRERPAGYVVHIEPEGGKAVGKFGGSGNVNDKNQIAFEDVPPGRYIRGHPNPSSGDQQTKPIRVDVRDRHTADVILQAR
jgi:hypothetical protein